MYFGRIVGSASGVCDRIAHVALVVMALLVCGNIVLRLFGYPILGTYEFAEFLAAVVISFSLAHCATQKGHVAIGILVERFPQRTQRLIDVTTEIITIGVFSLVIWALLDYATAKLHSGEVSMTLNLPFYPFIYGVAFGFIMLFLVLLTDLVKSVAQVVKR